MAPSRHKRRAVLDFSRGQTGDVATGDNAGGDITHGTDPAEVLAFLREYVFAADQRMETTVKALGREAELGRLDTRILMESHRSLRNRVDDLVNAAARDAAERAVRQLALDHQLAVSRRWLAGLTIALLVALAVVALLALDRYVLIAARAWFDVASTR